MVNRVGILQRGRNVQCRRRGCLDLLQCSRPLIAYRGLKEVHLDNLLETRGVVIYRLLREVRGSKWWGSGKERVEWTQSRLRLLLDIRLPEQSPLGYFESQSGLLHKVLEQMVGYGLWKTAI